MNTHRIVSPKAPEIWTRRPKILEPRREVVAPGPRVAGRFKLIAGKRDGRSRVLADWFPNLITDQGMDMLGAPLSPVTESYFLQQARVGTGTNAPNVNDTALQTEVANTGTASFQARAVGAQSEEPYFGWVRTTYRFGEGAAEGNLAEVGIGADGGNLFSRARILDGEGNPTTITVLADEFLDVIYELRLYPPTTDLVYSEFDFGGSDLIRILTIRPANVLDAAWWAMSHNTVISGTQRTYGENFGATQNTGSHRAFDGAITTTTAATSTVIGLASGSINLGSYTAGNHYIDTQVIWGLNQGNFAGGILSFYIKFGRSTTGSSVGSSGRYQLGVNAALPKDDTKIMSLTLRHNWSRAAI